MLDAPLYKLEWPKAETREAFLDAVFGSTKDKLTWRVRFIRWLTKRHIRGRKPIGMPLSGYAHIVWLSLPDKDRQRLMNEGFAINHLAGDCIGWAEQQCFFSRRAPISSGDAVAYIADGMPLGQIKFFVGEKADSKELVFYMSNPPQLHVIPRHMVRQAEKVEFLATHRSSLQRVIGNSDVKAMAQSLQLRETLPDVPHTGRDLRDAMVATLYEIRRRANALAA